jgi:hypothetical protein
VRGGTVARVALAVLGAAGAVPAWTAEGAPGLADGPLTLIAAVEPFGGIRRADPRSEVGLAAGAAAIIDEPGFYGMAQGALRVEGSWAVTTAWEVSGGLDALQFRYVQNATLQETSWTLGSLTLGATWRPVSLPGGELDVAIFAGMLLPTSLEYRNARVWGGELGASLRGQATSWLAWYGGVAFPVIGAVADAGSQARASATAAAGASWTPAAWFRLTLEIDARLPFGKPVEQVAAGLGLRFAAGRLGIELDGLLPFAGTSRFDVAALLRAAWRLDGG